jgi:UDP-N-acetyl-D-glucosamine dehydrogenase
VRESPALDIIALLEKRGAKVSYSDPYVPSIRLDRTILRSADLNASLEHADCVVVVTDHSVFDYEAIHERSQLIVDTRNAYKQKQSPKIVRL